MEERILEKLRKEQKKNFKKTIVLVITTAILFGTVGVAAGSFTAKQITFRPTDTTWKVNNVSDAIDSIKFNKTADNYSTDEQVIGEWIDGKKIYQKVITFAEIICGANTWTSIVAVPNNIEKLIYVDSIGVDSGTLPHNYSFIYQISQGNIMAYNTSNTTWGVDTLIMQYTKTTDETTN